MALTLGRAFFARVGAQFAKLGGALAAARHEQGRCAAHFRALKIEFDASGK
jgi:hypothetical protein